LPQSRSNQCAKAISSFCRELWLLEVYAWLQVRKYFCSPCVWVRHCSAEFMKHVLPRLLRPMRPFLFFCRP